MWRKYWNCVKKNIRYFEVHEGILFGRQGQKEIGIEIYSKKFVYSSKIQNFDESFRTYESIMDSIYLRGAIFFNEKSLRRGETFTLKLSVFFCILIKIFMYMFVDIFCNRTLLYFNWKINIFKRKEKVLKFKDPYIFIVENFIYII